MTSLFDIDFALKKDIEKGLEDVNKLINSLFEDQNNLNKDILTHLQKAGGKRIRPMLVLLCASFRGINEEVITAAASVELTHLASLYHDDVMDEAEARRGAKSAHIAWSNKIAILAGDVLFAESALLTSSLGEFAIKEHALTFKKLCLGQLYETVNNISTFDDYFDVLDKKTACLLELSCCFGAYFSGADENICLSLKNYGKNIGIAYQIIDDIIDIISPPKTLGKPASQDIKLGIKTLPLLYIMQKDKKLYNQIVGFSRQGDFDKVYDIFRAEGALDYSKNIAENYISSAVDNLRNLKDCSAKQALAHIANYILKRLS